MLINNRYIILLLLNFIYCGANVIIKTENGLIKGKKLKDVKGGAFYAFQSIPYAQPPLGPLRFKAPWPHKSWDGIWDATHVAPLCLQYKYKEIVGQEDCLYLNVYTPKLNAETNKLPVMVYIHGGAFIEGSGSYELYGPEVLVTENVVLVTINYRLGRFGSLSFTNSTVGVTGNAHLKDQVMALKWVQRNIGFFGGDKSCVTIFGESVGGASVHMHMLSPMSKNLFHRVIAQSGTALHTWNSGIEGTAEMIAKKLGIAYDNEKMLLDTLQNLSYEKIMSTQSMEGLGVPIHVKAEYGPIVEKQRDEPAFLDDTIENLIDSGKYTKVPFMLGYNNNDSLIFEVINRLYTGNAHSINNFDYYVPYDANYSNEEERLEIKKKMLNSFYGDENIKESNDIAKNLYIELALWLMNHLPKVVSKHVKTSSTPVYVYRFSGDTKLNFFKRLHPVTSNYEGASHMDELGYIFTTPNTPCVQEGSDEDLVQQNVLKLWTNFAKFGNPTPEDNLWPSVSEGHFYYLDIAKKLKAKRNPDKWLVQFVKELYNHDEI